MAYLHNIWLYLLLRKPQNEEVIHVLVQNMYTNLTLYRVLNYGESCGTILRVPTFVVKSFRPI